MTDWAKLKVVDLKAELKKRELPQHGLKAELVARLTEADEAPEAGAEVQEQQPAPGQEDDGGDQAEELQQQQHAGEEAIAVEQEQSQKKPTENPFPEEDIASSAENPEPPVGADKTDTETAQDAQELQSEPEAQAEPQLEPEAQKTESCAQEPESEAKETTHSEEMAIDSADDSQKRKRRSASPPPDTDTIAKRARTDDEASTTDIAPPVTMKEQPTDESTTEKADTAMEEAPIPEQDPNAKDEPSAPRSSPPRDASPQQPDEEMENARSVAPSIHPATPALYISNLMRPLRPVDIQTHLIDLATPPRVQLRNEIIVNFHLDQIRTHAFVVFDSISAASRVRTLLHDCVWPNESNRKALFVDFVPPEKVEGWIDMETGGGGRSSTRWEVTYADNPDGSVDARLESAIGSLSRPSNQPPPAAPMSAPTGPRISSDSANNIPLGPRGPGGPFSGAQPPSGPRPKRSGPGPFPPSTSLPGKRTRTHPVISYSTAPDDLARQRIRNMHSFYTDRRGPYGREINRYSFENGDNFVDRGKEVFVGIRPPHRERGGGGRGGGGGGRGRGGGGGGRPPRRPRPRSDRYLPGAGGGGGGGGGGSDRLSPPPRFGDDRR